MKKFTYALAALMSLSALNIGAVPAHKGVTTYQQPDGTILTVQRFGDERGHVYMTEDNYPLAVGENGGLYYATIDAAGLLQPSDVMASNVSRRQAPAKKLLSTMQQDVDVNALLKTCRAHSKKLPQVGMGRTSSTFPTKGKVKGLVVLVEYPDVKFTLSDPVSYFTDLLNKPGFNEYGATGSAYDYFYDASSGQFQPEFDVYGPVTLPEDRFFYGENDIYGNDLRPEFMATHAAEILDPDVDFSQYDTDGDGYIDNMYIFYAGQGEATYGPSDSVWPHSWDLHEATTTEYIFDGVRLDHYACSNEYGANKPDGIGTFVHEFSHVLGLPDLYDTTYAYSGTPQDWSVLDQGCYLNDSRTPAGYSIYDRNALGWIEPEEITGRASVELPAIGDSNVGYIINTSNEKEYYLFENRQLTGWDAYLPNHGMLIWHIDYNLTAFDNNVVNDSKNHQYVDIVEANNSPTATTAAMRGYCWPGSANKTSFTSTTTPAFKEWSGAAIDLPITNIAETNGVITFDVKDGWFELTTPTNFELGDITSSSVSVKWNKVDRATSYVLSVYTKDDAGNVSYVDGYEGLDLGDVDQYTVTRLQAETEYYFVLKATADEIESPLTDEQRATTSTFVFKEASVQALPATEVSLEGFNANWEELRDAVSYNLTVKGIEEAVTSEYYIDFGSGTSLTLPDGWTFSGTDGSTYVTAANYGEASPSLKFNKDGVALTSPDLGNQISEISFWCRGVNVSTSGSSLDIQVEIDGVWQTIYNVELATTASTVTIDDIPTGAQTMRFVYKKESGNCALDDVRIKCSAQTSTALPDYNNLAVGNVTTYRVDKLAENITKYVYTLTANNAAGEESYISKEIKVDLKNANNSGVKAIESQHTGAVEYFNLQGIRVSSSNLTPGIYIRRQGTDVKKVVVK
jgi:M6 family metalloprotease-like protein